MISYLGSLVQFSPAAGRAGRCRQMSLCVGSTRRVLAGQPEAWHPLPGCGAPFPSAESGPGSQRLGALSTGAPCPSAAPARAAGRVSGSLQTGTGACLPGGRSHPGFSGAEFAPFPSPCLLPPAGMGRLFSGVSQSLCFANRQRCVPAGQFFPRSPTV